MGRYEPNNDLKYRCRCGFAFGMEAFDRREICRVCDTAVMYRSDELDDVTKVKDFIDAIHDERIRHFHLMEGFNFSLSHMRIFDKCTTVMVYFKDTFYLIKDDNPVYDKDGNIDMEATYDRIKNIEFDTVTNAIKYIKNVESIHERYKSKELNCILVFD